MNLIFLFFCFTSLSLLSAVERFDVGDGSDGACVFTGAVAARTYNCTEATTSSNVTVTGTQLFHIKATTNVRILHTIDLSGSNGDNGSQTIFPTLGGAGISLGENGGSCTDALFCEPSAGFGIGAGGAGCKGNGIIGVNEAGGGGGAGGPGNETIQTAGLDGVVTDTVDDPGIGGAAGSGNYLEVADLQTTIAGGSGGGSGGSASNGINSASGGAGGAGGGAIMISAVGNIEISGSIISNGGDGGDGIVVVGEAAGSGAGGGGSGGVIFLQSRGEITVTGNLSAIGGNGGTGAPNAHGGNGGSGLIRIDDRDGLFDTSSTTPTATVFQSIADIIIDDDDDDDDDADEKLVATSTFSCGSIQPPKSKNYLFSFLLGLLLISTARIFSKSKPKTNSCFN